MPGGARRRKMGEKGNEGRWLGGWVREAEKAQKKKKAGGVIRNPDFPDLGILRRSLSKKKREERRGEGPIRNNWTLAAFSRGRKEGRKEGRNG